MGNERDYVWWAMLGCSLVTIASLIALIVYTLVGQ